MCRELEYTEKFSLSDIGTKLPVITNNNQCIEWIIWTEPTSISKPYTDQDQDIKKGWLAAKRFMVRDLDHVPHWFKLTVGQMIQARIYEFDEGQMVSIEVTHPPQEKKWLKNEWPVIVRAESIDK